MKTQGPNNVFDYPKKEKHREWGTKEPDWGLERRTLGYTPSNGLVMSDPSLFISAARERKLTVIMDERDESYAVYRQLQLDRLGTPVIIVAGHDRFWNPLGPVGVAQRLGPNFLHMFLDDYPVSLHPYDALGSKFSLTNLSINFAHQWDRPSVKPEKEFDISFFGYNSHPDRERFIRYIERHPRWSKLNNVLMLETRSDTLESFVLKSQYFDVMAKSRVCLNIGGGSAARRALRFYEIPFVGSFMLSQEPEFRQLHPFINGTHCGYFKDEDGLDNWLDFIFMEYGVTEGVCDNIAMNGYEHAMRYHTCEARVKYILETAHGS